MTDNTPNWDEYLPLTDAAKEMGIPYKTAWAYAVRDVLPGARLWNHTRWYVHKDTIAAFKAGRLNIKGAFRKGS